MVEVKLLKKWLGIWTFSMLQNKLREFIFKSNSNILGTNLRVSHFARNVNWGCTFCKLTNVQYNPAPMKALNTCFSHVIPQTVFWSNLRENFYLILILLTSWNEKNSGFYVFYRLTRNTIYFWQLQSGVSNLWYGEENLKKGFCLSIL